MVKPKGKKGAKMARTKRKGLKKPEKKRKLKKIPEKPKKHEEGKYVYGIIPSTGRERSFGNIGIEKNRVYTINYKDIAAVVSDAPVKEYSVTEDYTRKHEKVARTVLKNHSVVPAAFGQVFKNQKILRVLMRKAYKTLKESMKLVDNKTELGVKAILSKEIAESLDEKKKKQFEKKATEIFKKLNKNADESVKGRLFSNRLILNSSFLVDKRKIKGFSKEIETLSKKYRDMKISYSGPWPPYSFVYIKIGTKGIETGRKGVR
ncbi:MAG: GvpL/GvpF family gas vesicle protein [Thermoplasmatales archaeon]|nr:GvpL/GvpF family gas vesicle protein [Thermoplasmatales archaeon]